MAGNPKLVVLSEPLRGQSFELTEDQYVIGRVESCNICIPDPTMSSRHCILAKDGETGYRLIDQGSTNGTRINGIKISEQKLVASDILQFGSVEALFDCGQKSTTSSMGTKTGINLAAQSGKSSVTDMSNFSPFGSRSSMGGTGGKLTKILVPVVYAILGLSVLALLLYLVGNYFLK